MFMLPASMSNQISMYLNVPPRTLVGGTDTQPVPPCPVKAEDLTTHNETKMSLNALMRRCSFSRKESG